MNKIKVEKLKPAILSRVKSGHEWRAVWFVHELLLPSGPLYKEEPLSSPWLLKGNMIFDFISSYVVKSCNFNHLFLSGVVSSEASVKTLWEALAPDLQESVCESYAQERLLRGNKKQETCWQCPQCSSSADKCCCHQGGEKDRISLMNTCSVLINKQWGTSYSISLSVCSPLCVWMESLQITGNWFLSRDCYFSSLSYAIMSAWGEWWIEALLRPPHFDSPEKVLKFLVMESAPTSSKQDPNLWNCLTFLAFFFKHIRMLLSRNFAFVRCNSEFPEVSLLFTVDSSQSFCWCGRSDSEIIIIIKFIIMVIIILVKFGHALMFLKLEYTQDSCDFPYKYLRWRPFFLTLIQ